MHVQHRETPLEAPSVFLNANAQADDGEPLKAPSVFFANADTMSATDALQIISKYAGLSADDRTRLVRMLDAKKLDRLAQAIKSIQRTFANKSADDGPLEMPAVMLGGGR